MLRRFTLGKKIASGYATLLLITLASSLYSIVFFKDNIESDKSLADLYQPSLNAVQELRQLVLRSQRLTNNWIYQSNEDQKEELQNIHSLNFPETKQKIADLKSKWSESERTTIDEVFDEIVFLFDIEKKIMTLLKSKESYLDPEIVQSSIVDLEQAVFPAAKSIEIKISSLILQHQRNINWVTKQKLSAFSRIQQFMSVSLVMSLIIGIVFAVNSIRIVVRPINQLRHAVLALGKGELKEINIKKPNDEIGDMIESTNLLVSGLKKTTDFTEKIASGIFDEEHKSLSNIQALDDALFRMRDSLVATTRIEEKRKWVVASLANFSQILQRQVDIDQLGEDVISNLVKNLGAHQGGIFIRNDDSSSMVLELMAAYAYSKGKIHQKIRYGEGLVGQCWKDGALIHLTQGNESDGSIHSGLSEYKPKNVIIVPLKVNDDIFGVIELSSFKLFDKYALEFLERVCENIATSLMRTINDTRTAKLLTISQTQTEQLRVQEEEMRQMLVQSRMQTEQLQAQEEEMLLKQKQLEETITINSKLLSVISHDIKGPFATIKGLIKLYNNNMIADSELRGHMKKMEIHINSTDILFSNILQWSIFYIDKGLNRKSINLAQAVDNNFVLVSHSAQSKGIRLINDISEEIQIYADESLVNLVLRNFISNAVKFTENGSITISAKKSAANVEVSVKDTGIGMTPEEIASLFIWEKKRSTIGTRSERGTGVGLLICKEFIENNGGTLTCSSQIGVGTMFTFSLPANEMHVIENNDAVDKRVAVG